MTAQQQAWMKTSTMEEWAFEKALGLGMRLMKIDPAGPVEGVNLALVWHEDVEKVEDVLVEAMSLQGVAPSVGRSPDEIRDDMAEKWMRVHKGRACYELRQGGKTWQEIADAVGSSVGNAPTLAKGYALSHGKPWPLKTNS